jgi:calcineurin-like phosphoesterase family protein
MGARIFVTSDSHFGHAAMLRFKREDGVTLVRPDFTSVEEMNRTLIEQWNAVVRPQDHVYHLGDVAMSLAAAREFVPHLNGHKRLVLGNHDQPDARAYMAMGFKKIFGSRLLDDVLLTHIPIHPKSIPAYCLGNIHGHIHERAEFGPRYLNVSVEQTEYAPVSLESARAVLRARRAAADDIFIPPVRVPKEAQR